MSGTTRTRVRRLRFKQQRLQICQDIIPPSTTTQGRRVEVLHIVVSWSRFIEHEVNSHDRDHRTQRGETHRGQLSMKFRSLLVSASSCIHHLILADTVQSDSQQLLSHDSDIFRIAIIGAGPAGSSAAYHLSRFLNETSRPYPRVDISIFDSGDHPGGRSTTVNAFNLSSEPVELGASIFVKINHILYNATKEFGLVTNDAYHDAPKDRAGYGLGVWDGAEFLFKQASDDDDSTGWVDWRGWWDIARLLWRYGVAPIRTKSATKEAIGRFLRFYDHPVFPFGSLSEAVEEVGLRKYLASTGKAILDEAGVDEDFQRDIIQASTRVNYAQNLVQIHGLEALVCMAIEGAMSIKGGNWQIFDHMVHLSNAESYMNHNVTSIERSSSGYQIKHTVTDSDSNSVRTIPKSYDAVIIAAPFHSTNITFHPGLPFPPPVVDYVTLHVTLFTSPRRLSPSYFHQTYPSDVPTMILTTLPPNPDPHAPYARAVGPAKFWSISTLRTVRSQEEQEFLYKIFSPERITGSDLAEILGITGYKNTTIDDPIGELAKQDVGWSYEKVWEAYPYEVPRTEFDKIRLEEYFFEKDCSGDQDYKSSEGGGASVKPISGPRGLWYTGGMESFISTMETNALMGKNVARLIVDQLLQSETRE